jgi:membrane protein implicated in regulation of membrane protease activity
VADARAEYEVGYTSVGGTREKRQHFLEILRWHNRSRLQLRTAVESCKAEILAMEREWNAWAAGTRFQLATGEYRSPEPPLNKVNRARCELPQLESTPVRAPLGAALGPLKPIAGWLLATESVQLALIIGMLGAGLLGSAVTTFLRNQRQEDTSKSQLAGVMVRGVTAAIVVFLAAQGGLSTLAVGTSAEPPKPNPYVLLLVCFVAAVYSEQVWKTALKRLEKQLGNNTDGKQEDPADRREETQQPASGAEAGKAPSGAMAASPVTTSTP